MIYSNRFVVFIFILSAPYTANLFAQQPLFIDEGKENYSLGRYLSILEDKTGTLSIEETSSDSMQIRYVYHDKEILNFKFTLSAIWLRFIVVDTTVSLPSDSIISSNFRVWFLVKNDPIIEDIRVYHKDLTADRNKYIEKKAGSIIPVDNKIIKTNDFVARFPVQKNVPDTIYVRVRTSSQCIISFNILTASEYAKRYSKKNLFHGIFFGIFFLLIVYNSLLYFSFKEKTHIFYVLYILSYSIFIFIYEGYYFEIIGRIFHRDYVILPAAAVTLTTIFWLLLTREFLSTKVHLPWAYKLLTYLPLVGPINITLIFTLNSQTMGLVWVISNISFYIIGYIITIISLRKGIYLAKYYLIALSGMALGVIIISTTRNNFLPLPLNFWTQNSMHFGVLWEALVLAASVGYRFNVLRVEKEKEKALMRNQIAADLHDEVGSNLSTIALRSRLMMNEPLLDNNSRKQLQEITNTAGITTDIIRDIVWFINPFHDKSEDLILRMKELASKMLLNFDYSFNITKTDKHIFELLADLNQRRHVFLIYKEVLNNIIKHSEAANVSIIITAEERTFVMIISDNGKGFDEEQITCGEGLKNFRNRASQIGAQILIESNNGKGTKIILKVPLKL